MIYALGEIFLVVIGILIALQINNWNEGLKAAIQENSYLKRILSENEEDIRTFTQAILDLERGKKSIEDFSEALKYSKIEDSLLIQKANDYFKFGSIYPVFSPSNSTFEDLSSTGNLQVIKNIKLRESIVQYYAQHNRVKERIQIGIDWALLLDAPFTYENDIMQYEPTTSFLFPKNGQVEFAKKLSQNSLKYISNAAAHYWVNSDAVAHFQAMIQETKNLVSEIERELN
jgi:hypothetical protein